MKHTGRVTGGLDLESGWQPGILPLVQNSVQARRRWFGLLFLVLAGAMMIWGLTLLEPLLVGLRFVAYWTICIGFTAAALGVACSDLLAVRREQKRQMRELIRRTFDLPHQAVTPEERQQKPSGNTTAPDARTAAPH